MLELKTPSQDSTRFFLMAAALFLAPRIGWMLAVDAAPMSDQLWYFERAVGLLNGGGYAVQGQPTAFWPVGYPAFLAGLFAIFGPDIEVAKAANLVLSAVAMAFVYRIARHATESERAAKAALMLAVLYPTLIFYTELLYSELLFMTLLLAGIDLLLGADEHRRRWIAIAAAGVAIVAPIVAVAGLAKDVLFEARDAALDVVALAPVQAVVAKLAETILKASRLVVEPAGLPIAQDVTAIELPDLPLDLVDPHLQAADLAIIVVVAIGITLRLRRIPLGRSRSRDGDGRGHQGGGNQKLTHRGSPLERLMHALMERHR